MNDYTETEVKVFVTDLQVIAKRLEAAGATLEKPRVYEHNVRYEDAEQTLADQDIVVRLRRDARVRLTYKAPHPDPDAGEGGVRKRFEAEVTVDDFDAMDVILQRLGYFPHVVYEKYRTTYHLGEAEVVLDEMPFGNFIEVEGTAPVINKTLELLELAEERRITVSYMVLFSVVKRALGLSFHDLTFKNFENVYVPSILFRRLTDA